MVAVNPCYIKSPAANTNPGSQVEEEEDWESEDKELLVAVDPCCYKVPGSEYESSSQVEEEEDWESEDKELLVAVDPCCYKVPGSEYETHSQEDTELQGDVLTEDNKEGRESSGRRSCFYRSSQ